ncbi:MAG: radical SAM protein [Myxococcota bacterium]
MSRLREHYQRIVERERGTLLKEWNGRRRVALVYPNRYRLGMGNLGVHVCYRIVNARDDFLCERAFLPEPSELAEHRRTDTPLLTLESQRPVRDFDVLMFSVSFEPDYVGLARCLELAGIPLRAADRDARHPLVVLGGIGPTINPEPVADLVDLVGLGEAEPLLPPLLDLVAGADLADRDGLLRAAARIPGWYATQLYDVAYADDGVRHHPRGGAPERVMRRYVEGAWEAVAPVIVSPEITFAEHYDVEVSRSCLWGCRFCASGFVTRPYRELGPDEVARVIQAGALVRKRIGVVGTDVSDHRKLDGIAALVRGAGAEVSFPSLRVEALASERGPFARTLAGGTAPETFTVAPEAATERLRRVVNKKITDAEILRAVERGASAGARKFKFYMLVGIPTETWEDVQAIPRLARAARDVLHRVQPMGKLTLSVNPVIPKPWTPWQWIGLADVAYLKQAYAFLHAELDREPGLDVSGESPVAARWQTLLARGDRRVTPAVLTAAACDGNWRQALRGFEDEPRYTHRTYPIDERLAWDFIDHSFVKGVLADEYRKSLNAIYSPPYDPVNKARPEIVPTPWVNG